MSGNIKLIHYPSRGVPQFAGAAPGLVRAGSGEIRRSQTGATEPDVAGLPRMYIVDGGLVLRRKVHWKKGSARGNALRTWHS